MHPLRPGSWRPELIVDDHARRLWDPVTDTYVGLPAPFGRERVVFALATNGTGPVQVTRAKVLHDDDGHHIAAPDGALLGQQSVWVHRMCYAGVVEDSRRL